MMNRVRTGIPNLDSAIEGGFPEGSLILLVGGPGAGKTVFGMKFLLYGAMDCRELGVLASFTEGRKALIENTMNHFKCDMDDFQGVDVLDFVAVKEKGIESVTEMIIGTTDDKKAKRLVIDSFTAMTTGLAEKIDVRILAQVLGKLVKQAGCTTILITDIPTGTKKIGVGVEEFVADGLIVLTKRIKDGRTMREMRIPKLRGTKIEYPRYLFTLEDGFHVFPRFTFKMPEPRKEFKPRPDTEAFFSSGSEDLDRLLRGGWRRGSTNLVEVGAGIDHTALLNLIFITALNFVMHANRFSVFDPLLCNADTIEEHLKPIIGEDRLNQLVKCFEVAIPSPCKTGKFVVKLKGEKTSEDMETILGEIGLANGPTYSFISLDDVANYYNEDGVANVLTHGSEKTRRTHGLLVLKAPTSFGKIEDISSRAAVHLKLEEMDGAVVLYGIRPHTVYHVMEADTSRGYPDLRLTRIL